jgi:hypothetical protein
MNLKWFVSPVLALAVSVASGSWAKATQEQAPPVSDVCDYVPVASIADAKQLFAEFALVR